MAFTFKAKKRPNPLQVGLAHFAKGFAAGGVKAMQQRLELEKKNKSTLKSMNNVVSQLWSQIKDPTIKNKVSSIRLAASMGSFSPNEYLLSLSESGVFEDRAFADYAKALGIITPIDTRPIIKSTNIIDGRKVISETRGRNGKLISESSNLIATLEAKVFKSKITNVSNGIQTVTEIEKDADGNIISERVISEKPVAGSITVINKATHQKEKILLSNYLADKDNYDIPSSSFEEFFNDFLTEEEAPEEIEKDTDQETMNNALEFKKDRLGSPSS
jgi:hypothetical protein